jgi:putative FmdB family regulatory protein
MPLYEYRCPNGHEFEKFFRSIGSAEVQTVCPTCGAVAERMLSAAGLVFKGSGFYITDYGKDGKKAEREAASLPISKPESPAPAPTEGTKTESKSDTASGSSAKSSETPAAKAEAPKSEPVKSSPKKTKSE